MPRTARAKSDTGFYHVLLTSVADRQLFTDRADYRKFLEILKDNAEKFPCFVCAYSLMKDHAHILIQLPENKPGAFIKKVTTKYAFYINKKTGLSGAIFYDRFKSKPLNTVGEYSETLVGMHRAPSDLKLIKDFEGYPYSSYKEYVNKNSIKYINPTITNNMFSKKQFILLHENPTVNDFMKITRFRGFISDEIAETYAKEILGENFGDISSLEDNIQLDYIVSMTKKRLSIRQMSLFTNMKNAKLIALQKKATDNSLI